MQSLTRQVVRVAAVLLLAVTAACASSGATESPDTAAAVGTGLTINVQNDHASSSAFTLFIEPTGGVRQSLGTVGASASRTFTFNAAPGIQYVLVRQTNSGDARSERFTMQGATTVTWDIGSGRLTVTRR